MTQRSQPTDAGTDPIMIRWGRIPRANLFRMQFLCEGHEGVAIIHTQGGDPPVLRLLIARDRLEEWDDFARECSDSLGFEYVTEDQAFKLRDSAAEPARLRAVKPRR